VRFIAGFILKFTNWYSVIGVLSFCGLVFCCLFVCVLDMRIQIDWQKEETVSLFDSKHLSLMTCFGEANETLGIVSLEREQVMQRLISTENLRV
jgi:hypothetical protein